jgi:FtsZ-interacting cell division protein ZipA
MKYLNVILIGVIAICTVVLVFSLFTLNKRRQQRVTNITPNNQLSNAQEDSTKPALLADDTTQPEKIVFRNGQPDKKEIALLGLQEYSIINLDVDPLRVKESSEGAEEIKIGQNTVYRDTFPQAGSYTIELNGQETIKVTVY